MVKSVAVHETNIHRPFERAETHLKQHQRSRLCRSTELLNASYSDNGFFEVPDNVGFRNNVKRNPLFSIPKAKFNIGRVDRAVVSAGIQLCLHGDWARIDHNPFQIPECRRLGDGIVGDAEYHQDDQY